jgi:hypothetical protein
LVERLFEARHSSGEEQRSAIAPHFQRHHDTLRADRRVAAGQVVNLEMVLDSSLPLHSGKPIQAGSCSCHNPATLEVVHEVPRLPLDKCPIALGSDGIRDVQTATSELIPLPLPTLCRKNLQFQGACGGCARLSGNADAHGFWFTQRSIHSLPDVCIVGTDYTADDAALSQLPVHKDALSFLGMPGNRTFVVPHGMFEAARALPADVERSYLLSGLIMWAPNHFVAVMFDYTVMRARDKQAFGSTTICSTKASCGECTATPTR